MFPPFDLINQDSECYSYLLYSLDGDKDHLNCLQSNDPLKRAQSVIDGATVRSFCCLRNDQSLGVEPFLHEQDIASGNEKLNLAFVAMIFKACTGLEEVDPKKLYGMIRSSMYGQKGDACGCVRYQRQ